MEIIDASQLQTLQPRSEPNYELDCQQTAVKTHIVNIIIAQHAHYYWQNINFSLHSDDNYSDSDNEDINEHNLNQPDLDHFILHIQWQKPILITGKTGFGKLHTILACVPELIDRNVNILIVSPTGFLSSVFRAKVSDYVMCDTVHAAFCITVNIQ